MTHFVSEKVENMLFFVTSLLFIANGAIRSSKIVTFYISRVLHVLCWLSDTSLDVRRDLSVQHIRQESVLVMVLADDPLDLSVLLLCEFQ